MRVHGGTTGILAAILFGRLDPFTGRDAKDYKGPKRRRSSADWRRIHRRNALRLLRRA